MFIGIGIAAGFTRGGGAYNVASALFASGEVGVWYDPSDLATVWEDSARTIPASVNGVVGAIDDKSGNGKHATQATTSLKPILRQSGALYYLDYDGVDDGMATAAIDFSASDQATVIIGITKNSDATVAVALELSANSGSNNGAFGINAPNTTGASGDFGFGVRGTSARSLLSGTLAATTTRVITGLAEIDPVNRVLRVDGSQVASDTINSVGTGNFGNYPIYLGRRGGTTLPFNGRQYAIIVRSAFTSGTDLTDAEAYVAEKTGVTI